MYQKEYTKIHRELGCSSKTKFLNSGGVGGGGGWNDRMNIPFPLKLFLQAFISVNFFIRTICL